MQCYSSPKPKNRPMESDGRFLESSVKVLDPHAKKRPFEQFVNSQKKTELKLCMENRANTKKLWQLAELKMRNWLAQNRQDLEERRDRLYTMLEDEDDCYRKEITTDFENRQTNRLDEMRKRVTTLRANREEINRQFVEQKLDQCFQSQCEQMRSLLSKRMTKEIVRDWGTQIELKNRLECEQQLEEQMWAQMSELDIQEKAKREEAEKAIRQEASQRALEDLQEQLKIRDLRKAEAFKIKLRELAMLQADMAFLAQERENREQQKVQRSDTAKSHVKEMIAGRQYYVERNAKREAIAAREFLKQAVRDLYMEEEDRGKKKQEAMRALHLYSEYCRNMDCLKNQKEEAVQSIVNEVVEEQYRKSMAFRFRESEQRRDLHRTVLAGRALQVEDKKKLKEIEEAETRKELEQLKLDWKAYLDELEQERLNKEANKIQYICDLNGQVKYLQKLKQRDECERLREEELCKLEERLFNHKLRTTLKQATLSMSNPTRECLRGKPIRQCFRQV